jgi:hypothetical protein
MKISLSHPIPMNFVNEFFNSIIVKGLSQLNLQFIVRVIYYYFLRPVDFNSTVAESIYFQGLAKILHIQIVQFELVYFLAFLLSDPITLFQKHESVIP